MPNILLDTEYVEGLKKRIAELEDQLEQELDCCKQLERMEAERDRLRESILPDDDCLLRQILLEIYGHTNGKEWKVMHKLKEALEETT